MTNENRSRDPSGSLASLQAALNAVARAGTPSPLDWTALAAALGRCRLFGMEPGPDLDGTLTIPQARMAIAALASELLVWAERTRQLGETWDRTTDPDVALDLACSPLENRMDAWGALVALDEAYEAGLADGDPDSEKLADDLNAAMDALDAFDGALEGQLPLLSLAVGTQLLDSWRAWLAPEFAAEKPWWLDGRLEAEARRVSEVASASGPSSTQMAELRRRLGLVRPSSHPAARLPALRKPAVGAAASVGGTAKPGPSASLCWESPDGLWRAVLHLPAWSDRELEQVKRPVNFASGISKTRATDLDGLPVRLGPLTGVIADARFHVTLEQLRSAAELDLAVGEPAVLWTALPDPTKENA